MGKRVGLNTPRNLLAIVPKVYVGHKHRTAHHQSDAIPTRNYDALSLTRTEAFVKEGGGKFDSFHIAVSVSAKPSGYCWRKKVSIIIPSIILMAGKAYSQLKFIWG